MDVMRARVLCADGETLQGLALARQLAEAFEVTAVHTAQGALAQLAQGQPFHVIAVDQRLPGLPGLELLRQARARWPQAMRVLMVRSAELAAVSEQAAPGEVFRYIVKPSHGEGARRTIVQAAEMALRASHELLGERTMTGLALSLHHEDLPFEVDGVPLVMAEPAPAAEITGITDSALSAGNADVLLVDSDERTRRTVDEACAGRHRVFRAETLPQAQALLQEHTSIGVVISEVQIGAATVTQLLEHIRREHPAVVAMVASGYGNANLVVQLINQGRIFRFVGKPLASTRVRELVRRASVLHQSMRPALYDEPEAGAAAAPAKAAPTSLLTRISSALSVR